MAKLEVPGRLCEALANATMASFRENPSLRNGKLWEVFTVDPAHGDLDANVRSAHATRADAETAKNLLVSLLQIQAVLHEMREPSFGMVHAGLGLLPGTLIGVDAADAVQFLWRSMIDEALKETSDYIEQLSCKAS